MRSKQSRLLLVATLVLSVTGGLVSGSVADAKKKKKGKTKSAKTFTVTNSTPVAVPLANGATSQPGGVKVPIGTVGGKKLRGKVIGFSTVEVTTSFSGQAGFAGPFTATLISPNGRNVVLASPIPNNIITPTETFSGPTTETPNSPVSTCIPGSAPGFSQPPCGDPDATLGPPYQGTLGTQNLVRFAGISPLGQWTLKVLNFSTTTTGSLTGVTVTGDLINAPR